MKNEWFRIYKARLRSSQRARSRRRSAKTDPSRADLLNLPLLALALALRRPQIPDGKPENTFAFSGEAKNRKYATEVVHECHEAWRKLISGEANKGKIDLCVAPRPLVLHHPELPR